jgi:hypothetical protein
VIVKLLPRRPPPLCDELLSSWLTRLAQANHCSTEELCGYLGLQRGRVSDRSSDLEQVCVDRLCAAVGRKRTEIAAMTLPNLNTRSLNYLATHDFQTCKHCQEQTPGLILRHWRFAWSTNCESCGRSLVSTCPHAGISKRMKARAVQGAKRLASAVVSGDQQSLHQFRQTSDLLQLWKLADADALISENQAQRTIVLAAIELGSRRSFQRFAYRVGRNSRVAQSLLRAFPRQREALETIQKWARLSENRYSEREVTVRRATDECRKTTKPAPSKRALTATQSAVQELGSNADRLALLLRAQEILQAETISRRSTQPVEIS